MRQSPAAESGGERGWMEGGREGEEKEEEEEEGLKDRAGRGGAAGASGERWPPGGGRWPLGMGGIPSLGFFRQVTKNTERNGPGTHRSFQKPPCAALLGDCRHPSIPAPFLGARGRGCEPELAVGVPAHGRAVELDGLPTQMIL